MNAQDNSIRTLSRRHFGQIAGGAVAALAIVSMTASLLYVNDRDVRAQSAPIALVQQQSTNYFPAQIELSASSKDGAVFEY